MDPGPQRAVLRLDAREAVARVAATLTQLQAQSRALRERDPAAALPSRKSRAKPRNNGRTSAFRRFLIATYGEEALGAGSGMLE